MKISINPEVRTLGTMSYLKNVSGLNYSTIMKLCKGTFAPQTFSMLAKYLTALGYTAADIADMKVKDLFDISD